MKKVYRLENLDCAVCAEKMKNAIAKIDGVAAWDALEAALINMGYL